MDLMVECMCMCVHVCEEAYYLFCVYNHNMYTLCVYIIIHTYIHTTCTHTIQYNNIIIITVC